MDQKIRNFVAMVAAGNTEFSDLERIARELLSNDVQSVERETRIDAGTDDGQAAEELLEIARQAQTEFWDALRNLEECLGVEIDDNRDLQDCEIDDLTRDDDEDCRQCGEPNVDGEGYDGLCGSCADKSPCEDCGQANEDCNCGDAFTCKGCGRPEGVCSADPCPGVIADRCSCDDPSHIHPDRF